MGVPTGGGQLGAAQGRINIDVSQLAAAQVAVQNASRQINQAMSSISPNVQRAQVSINQLRGALQQLGGVFGITFGAAGVAQLARFVAEADALATAYRRQNVAAVNLAGSQERLNELLLIYQRATGGALDQATALSNLTQLIAVGFADSAEELDQFARAIRGISVAMGRSQDMVTQNLILELFSQRGQRLDQLGLQYDKVRQRAEQLRDADRSLTQEMAYQQAVLEQAIERYGALADSAAAQATGIELLGRAWKEARREIGEAVSPVTDALGTFAAAAILLEIGKLQAWANAIEQVGDAWEELLRTLGFAPSTPAPTVAAPAPSAVRAPRFNEDQTAVITEWWRQTQEIERQAARDRIEATRQFEQQRTDTIRQYEKTIAREAQDFALARARSEEDYAISLQRTHRDIAQREARQLEDLERTIADARMDAAERQAERVADFEERVAETRAATQERIAELEEDFARRRVRAQRDHAERLRDAAANLDAVRVRELQREYRNRQRDEQEDFDERLEKERRNEEKRLADLEKAHNKQIVAQQRALDKQIRQANESYQRQLEDARAADAQRLEDQAADFALRQERENEDRAIRLERLQQDHEDQLAEQVRQHELRLIQIAEQEQEERDRLDEEFQKELDALGIRTQAYRDKLHEYETAAIEAFDRVWAHWLGAMQGPQPLNPLITPGQFPSLNPAPVAPLAPSNFNNSTRSVVIQSGAITIVTPANFAADERSRQWLHGELAQFFEDFLP